MFIRSMLENEHTDTNLWFLHRGNIPPKAGIGAHFHNNCEEMFIILNGEAQFTIDGHTSVLKGPAGAPVRMGHSHAIYNPDERDRSMDEHQRRGASRAGTTRSISAIRARARRSNRIRIS